MIEEVEVWRQNADGSAGWYLGQVVDYRDGAVSVQIGSEAPFVAATDSVRVPRESSSSASFLPQAGGVCEVLKKGPGESVSWAECRIKQIKGEFYYVYDKDPNAAWIVEKSNLRPADHSAGGFTFGNALREVLPLGAELRAWVSDEESDCDGCLQQVAAKVGLLICKARVNDADEAEVVLVGEKSALRRAKILLDVHLKHQRAIQKFHTTRDKKMKMLEERKSKYNEQCSYEFVADARVSGFILGKEGKTIKRVRQAFDVEIIVTDLEDTSPAQVRVRIYGETQEQVDRAREEIEYTRLEFPVEPHLIGWVLGKKGAHLTDIEEKSGIVRASLNRTTNVVELIGLKDCVEDAKMALESHCTYFEVYKEMDDELLEIDNSFAELGANGKGGKKGKGKKGRGKSVRDDEEGGENSRPSKKGQSGKKSRDSASSSKGADAEKKGKDNNKSGSKNKSRNSGAGGADTPSDGTKAKANGSAPKKGEQKSKDNETKAASGAGGKGALAINGQDGGGGNRGGKKGMRRAAEDEIDEAKKERAPAETPSTVGEESSPGATDPSPVSAKKRNSRGGRGGRGRRNSSQANKDVDELNSPAAASVNGKNSGTASLRNIFLSNKSVLFFVQLARNSIYHMQFYQPKVSSFLQNGIDSAKNTCQLKQGGNGNSNKYQRR
ncbi:unnamed protein product [Amoebophrya sp. A25]|nr:unnamed protein product [Amoebophrya sp. A25]|eukprot:GSA25T00001125001.1